MNKSTMAMLLLLAAGIYYLWPTENSTVLHGTHPKFIKQFLGDNVEIVTSTVPPSPLRGIALLFHGCSHDPDDWMTLPEDRQIVRVATEAGLLPVAVGSEDRTGSRCWSLKAGERDRVRVAVDTLKAMHVPRLDELPVFAIGASSGGTFATTLSSTLKLAGVLSIVSPGDFTSLSSKSMASTAFIYMTGDTRWASASGIAAAVSRLTANGIASRQFACHPKPVTAATLHSRLKDDGVTFAMAQAIYEALVKAHALDAHNMLVMSPRKLSRPSHAIYQTVPATAHAALEEELNVLFSEHENTSEHVAEALSFLIEHSA